jgi:hypothetical protein
MRGRESDEGIGNIGYFERGGDCSHSAIDGLWRFDRRHMLLPSIDGGKPSSGG